MRCSVEYDTVIDFKERFYKNDTLACKNEFLDFSDISKIKVGDTIPRSKTGELKQGLWIEYLDKNFVTVTEKKSKYFRLVEYSNNQQIKKCYYFTKRGKLLHSTLGFPIYEQTTFNGYRKITYNKQMKLKSISYEPFTDDTLAYTYYNYTEFYSNGKVKSSLYRDDIKDEFKSEKFDKSGRTISHFSKQNGMHKNYTYNYNRNIKKEIFWINDELHKVTYKKGKLKKEKIDGKLRSLPVSKD